jgi:putative addiction module killer protein
VFVVKALPEFTSWLDKLTDASVRGVVVSRIKRLERGLLGDAEPVGDGVSELRIHIGPDGVCTSRSVAASSSSFWLADPSARKKSDIGRAKALAALLD